MTENVPAVSDRTPTQLARPAEPDMGQLLSAIAQGGVTTGNVEALERIAAVWERQEERMARRDFDDALADLQAQCQMVNPNREIPGKREGEVRSVFADYPTIWKEVGPLIARHRFNLTWDSELLKEPTRIVAVCHLSKGGHTRTTRFAVRVSAPPGCSDAQADGSTMSYAKRYALCNALNIVVGFDDDARLDGETITPAEAADLERRARKVFTDAESLGMFLDFCGAETFLDIRRGRFEAANAELERRPTAVPSGPACPAPLDSHAEWRDAMVDAMSARWGVALGDADKALSSMLSKQTGTMTPERRGAAWNALHAGGLDKYRPMTPTPPEPPTGSRGDLFPDAKPTHPDAKRR